MSPTRLLLRRWLRRRADQPRENFILLLVGFFTALIGLALIHAGEYLFHPSISAELIALAGLILLSIGLILAAVGYISLSILRILRFLDSDDDTTPPRH